MVILLKKYHPYIYILRMGEKREVERSSQLPVGWKSMKRPEPSGREINYHISPEGKHFRSLTSALASIKHATEPSFVEASAIAAAPEPEPEPSFVESSAIAAAPEPEPEPEPVNQNVPGLVYLIHDAKSPSNVYKVGYTATVDNKRIYSYLLGSKVISQERFPNPRDVEDTMKKVFNSHYSLYAGKEYFICDNIREIQLLFNRTVNTLLESEVLHNI